MQNFEWIQKAFLGVIGTTLSIMFEHLSSLLSMGAALLTIIYIYAQIRYMKVKRDELLQQHIYNKARRRRDAENDKLKNS